MVAPVTSQPAAPSGERRRARAVATGAGPDLRDPPDLPLLAPTGGSCAVGRGYSRHVFSRRRKPRAGEFSPDIGSAVAGLYVEAQAWRHRRVDSVRLEPDGTFRWRTSLDCTLPADPRLDYPGTDQRLIWLSFLAKKPLIALDVRDGAGTVVPVVKRAENGFIGFQAIRFALETEMGRLSADVQEALNDLIFGQSLGLASPEHLRTDEWTAQKIGSARVAQELADRGEFRGRRILSERQLGKLSPATKAMISDFANGFMLLGLTARRGNPIRTTYKFAYTTSPMRPRLTRQTVGAALGYTTANVELELSGFGEASSYHLEFHAPPELACVSIHLPVDEEPRASAASAGSAFHAHGSYSRFPDETELGQPRVDVAASTGITRTLTWTSCLLTAALLGPLVVWAQVRTLLLADNTGSASALLLALPAAGVGYLVSTRTDVLTHTLLRPLRWLSVTSFVLLGASAAAVAIRAGWQWLRWPATAGAIVATLGCVALASGAVTRWIRYGRRVSGHV